MPGLVWRHFAGPSNAVGMTAGNGSITATYPRPLKRGSSQCNFRLLHMLAGIACMHAENLNISRAANYDRLFYVLLRRRKKAMEKRNRRLWHVALAAPAFTTTH